MKELYFDGMISGVIGSGFFVELENTAEGYVPAEVLADDYDICDEQNSPDDRGTQKTYIRYR